MSAVGVAPDVLSATVAVPVRIGPVSAVVQLAVTVESATPGANEVEVVVEPEIEETVVPEALLVVPLMSRDVVPMVRMSFAVTVAVNVPAVDSEPATKTWPLPFVAVALTVPVVTAPLGVNVRVVVPVQPLGSVRNGKAAAVTDPLNSALEALLPENASESGVVPIAMTGSCQLAGVVTLPEVISTPAGMTYPAALAMVIPPTVKVDAENGGPSEGVLDACRATFVLALEQALF